MALLEAFLKASSSANIVPSQPKIDGERPSRLRPDLTKVLTEQPRRRSDLRKLKTRAGSKIYDEASERRSSLPKIGKM
jgi:hypothetical protein